MKNRTLPLTAVLLVACAVATAHAQTVSAPSGKSLSATIGVYVFPEQGQTAAQQGSDESACYSWAVQNVGTDPFELSRQAQQDEQAAAAAKQQAKQAGQGAGAAGAVKGAAAGALIGGIASNDAGKGAAWGAGVGLIAGRQQKKQAQKKASAQVEQQASANRQYTQAQMDAFKKAFSVCLEAKSYLVKF